MYVDLLTLYFLAIGTLLASAGMMFWEHRTHPRRSHALRTLAAGFGTMAVGCTTVLFRRELPGATGSALSNLIILGGYLLVLNGVATLSGRKYRAFAVGLLVAMALVWVVSGARWQDLVWNHLSALPIALVSALTAWEMRRCDAMKALFARRIVVLVAGVHALIYLGRAIVLPWLVTEYGPTMQLLASQITMYEGVLYSVILPMTLLKLVREETHGELLVASQTDYLTRLGNRRWFFEQGGRVANGGNSPAALLAFDLDQFKAINDRYGHQTGDKVLKSFADVARDVLGPNAILARIGGEEFAALLAGDTARRAATLGETIAQRFAASVPDQTEDIGMSTTVSVGLAMFEDRMPMLAEALATADQALYRAKAMGGNRLVVAEIVAQA